ncbi:hypothetical protein BJY04DRAFT_229656 [Aspergillus karnatakaensis]|uniref:uncharacterized protein n=1 Tax=Aspergillus karnatakaensis TaxID=1810916 RepID=UPI003CCE4F18
MTLTCPLCRETFQRIEHLKRHASTHDEDKPHVCQFCSSQYKRSDALRRHWKTCSQRISANHEIPKRSISGKRKQACDACTSRKRACSTEKPCTECLMRETECTYHAAQRGHDVQGPVAETPYQPGQSEKVKNLSVGPSNLPTEQFRFNFLANFTKARGLNEAYNYRSSTKSFACGIFSGATDAAEAFHNTTSFNPFDFLLDDLGPNAWEAFRATTDSNQNDDQAALIFEKSCYLWESLQPIIRNATVKHLTLSFSEWFAFFAPENVTHYLCLFWTRWYSHCPIIHKATFSLNDCSPLLLAAMALIGACMSSIVSDQQAAKGLLDAVEELTFIHPMFSETTSSGGPQEHLLQNRENIQTLQAACFICLLQKWEGSAAAKLRMQRHRFTAFVAITRAMGLSQAMHPPINLESDLGDEAWKEYILRAEMIRTFNHVFLLDSAFVIFHNSVPRMVLQEMTCDLTCPEDAFQAASAEEFTKRMRQHHRDRPALLTDCVRELCAETSDPEVLARLHHESALNLFTIATAIHGLIFHQLRAFSPLPLATGPLRRALGRWELAWEASMGSARDVAANEEVAFPLHAREFAALARVHIEKSHLSPQQWNDMLNKLPEHLSVQRREGLATFDQTEMHQVADLIRAVEHLDIK